MNKVEITYKDKAGVFLWRNILLPTIATIGGKRYPSGKVKEFSYGNLKDEKLDFIAPSTEKEIHIAIVHIHGGAWVAGSKGNLYSRPLMKYSDAGYPVFSLNYPLALERPHPHMLQSLLKGLLWINKNYPQYTKIHLIGDSAGGNLAMMLGIYISNPELLKLLDSVELTDLPVIISIVNIYGVNDRVTWVEDGFPNAKLFNKVYLENSSTPHIPALPMEVEYIENLPPTFIVGAGKNLMGVGKDQLLRSSIVCAERIGKKFDDVEFKIYERGAHGFFCLGKGSEELSDDMLTFFGKHNS